MTLKEAKQIRGEFADKQTFSDEELFMFSEAMDFLIEKEKNPADMMFLGGVYYDLRHFDLALKYYEMASTYDYREAFSCLGYIWYYGRTGEKDYEKAFRCYSKAMDMGCLTSTYKVADMYKNGYFVEKDYEKYKKMIKELYPKVKELNNVFDPIPEVYTRLAKIKIEEMNNEEALNLYSYAKDILAQRISINPFFGSLNIMKWLIEDVYTIVEFDNEYFDLYDLYHALKKPMKVVFDYDDKTYEIESIEENGECVISFNGSWYRTLDDFFAKAKIDGELLTTLYFDLYAFEVR